MKFASFFLGAALTMPISALAQAKSADQFPKLEKKTPGIVQLRGLEQQGAQAVTNATYVDSCQALAQKLLLGQDVVDADINNCGIDKSVLNNDPKKALTRLSEHIANLKQNVQFLENLTTGYSVAEGRKNLMRLHSVTSNPDTGASCSADIALNNTIIKCFATDDGLPSELQSSCSVDPFTHKEACGHAKGSGGTITVKYICGSGTKRREHTIETGDALHISCGTDLFKAPR